VAATLSLRSHARGRGRYRGRARSHLCRVQQSAAKAPPATATPNKRLLYCPDFFWNSIFGKAKIELFSLM